MLYRFIGLLAVWLASAPLMADPLPARAYGQLPAIRSMQLSPNGRQLGLLQNIDGKTVLGVNDLVTNKASAMLVTDNKKFRIRWYRWGNDRFLLVSADYPYTRYGVETIETRLLKIDVRDPANVDIVYQPRQRVSLGGRDEHFSQFQDRIVSLLPGDDDHILLEMDLDTPTLPSVYKVNLADGSKSRQRNVMGYVHSWLADQQGRVRLGAALDETRVFYRLFDIAKNEWRTIWEYEIFDAPDITPLGFGLDPNQLYIRALHNERYAIFRVDVASADLKRELVYADPHYDVEGSLIYSPKTHDVVGVWHGESETGGIYWSAYHKALQGVLDKALPGAYNAIVSTNRDENLFVAYSSSERNPGSYFLGNLTTGNLVPVASTYPQLDAGKLSARSKVKYTARDGQVIEAYLSRPAGSAPGKPLPAVVMPHGGPQVRDYADFDYEVEFLVSRGYLVLQPNFRGSSGYGFRFEMQAVQKWGGPMQDDLEDAAQWLVREKLAPADAIGIVGSSYGGYAALMAAATQQKTFRCAASIAGVTDLDELVAHSRYYKHSEVVEKQIGNKASLLRQKSPVYLADRITMPVLLVHGDKDRIVPVGHGRDMRDALKKHGKTFQYVELENGDHSLRIEEHRVKVLELLDAFLADNLKH